MPTQDLADSFCAAFSEEEGVSGNDVLGEVQEAKPHDGPFSSLETLVISLDVHDAGALSKDAAVDHRLVAARNGGGVVQNHHTRIKLSHGQRRHIRSLAPAVPVDGIHDHHALPEPVAANREPLAHRLEAERRALTRLRLSELHASRLDAAHCDRIEGSGAVGTHIQQLTHSDGSPQNRASYDDSNPTDLVHTVDGQVGTGHLRVISHLRVAVFSRSVSQRRALEQREE
mmetsp:Transcript_105570/g.227535  ORF Transcript_105570/g.227535 Transcript_105570/m.227535 type:complete len:229 (-) Transcript_105570:679-1365(-)